MDRQPLDLSDYVEDAYEERIAGEMRATGIIDGRKLRRSGRNKQIGLKTSVLKAQQLQRLALRTRQSMTEVIEAALDAYERELDRQ
jgi:hypothetical protein